MSLKVDVLKLVERKKWIVFDVMFFKEAKKGEKHIEVGMNLCERVQALTSTLKNWFSECDALILSTSAELPMPFSGYGVSFIVICHKDEKDYFIDRMKAMARYRGLEIEKTENLSRSD